MVTQNFFTKDGYRQLQEKLSELQTRRDELSEQMELARQEGDLAENSAYHQLREAVNLVSSQIDDLEGQMTNAKIIENNGGNGTVNIGNKVTVEVSSLKKSFEIVGNGEADPVIGKISYQSPIGASLMGRKKGETVKIRTPTGETEYVIVSID